MSDRQDKEKIDKLSKDAQKHAEKIKDNKAKFDKLGEKAMKDRNYRKRLKDNPASILKEEGIEVPADAQIVVLDVDPKKLYLFMPPTEVFEGGQ